MNKEPGTDIKLFRGSFATGRRHRRFTTTKPHNLPFTHMHQIFTPRKVSIGMGRKSKSRLTPRKDVKCQIRSLILKYKMRLRRFLARNKNSPSSAHKFTKTFSHSSTQKVVSAFSGRKEICTNSRAAELEGAYIRRLRRLPFYFWQGEKKIREPYFANLGNERSVGRPAIYLFLCS